MLSLRLSVIVGATVLLSASPALAQRFAFERALTVGSAPRLDVSTKRGRIAITPGDVGHVAIRGTVTVRTAFDVPANAVELARALAATPEIDQQGDLVRLRPPSDATTDRAVTVSYEIQVPPGTSVTTDSDS